MDYKDSSFNGNGEKHPSSGKQVKVATRDPMNDTQFISQNLCNSLDELARLKAEVKKKHDTSILRAARIRHSLRNPSTPS